MKWGIVAYGDKDKVMTWTEQLNNVYEREECGKKKEAMIEMKITEVGSM